MDRHRGNRAVLYLNDEHVGDVVVKGWDASWGFGDFQPAPAFSRFALVFGRWSLLMHADDDGSKVRRLSREASEELRETENKLDALHAKLYFPEKNEWLAVAQLNIDGALLEWKEY